MATLPKCCKTAQSLIVSVSGKVREKDRVNLNRNIKVEGEGQVARTIMSKVTQRGMLA